MGYGEGSGELMWLLRGMRRGVCGLLVLGGKDGGVGYGSQWLGEAGRVVSCHVRAV